MNLKYVESHNQLTFTCSKSTIETIEKSAQYVQKQLQLQWTPGI